MGTAAGSGRSLVRASNEDPQDSPRYDTPRRESLPTDLPEHRDALVGHVPDLRGHAGDSDDAPNRGRRKTGARAGRQARDPPGSQAQPYARPGLVARPRDDGEAVRPRA